MADVRVPGYLGRVLADGMPAGTCFQVAPGVVVTAWHVLADVGAAAVGATVWLDALDGGPVISGEVVRADPEHDLAVLSAVGSFATSVAGLAATDSLSVAGEVVVTGVSAVEDPDHEYRYLDAVGTWGGGTVRDDRVRLGRLETPALVRGMSGAPVRRLADDVVVGVVSARYNSVDGWLRNSVWVIRTEDLAPLLEGMAVVAPPSGRLSGHVPRLPRNFVARADDVTALAGALLSGEQVVVHGMPGIGKTVLAAALARDDRVRQAFPDGVLWVTLGRERNLTRSQALLAEDLGENVSAFGDPAQGTAKLRTLLATRTCLLVLDDVWHVADLEAFDVLGPHGRLVVTTRDARVAVALSSVDYQVSVLPEDQAVELLVKWAGQHLDSAREIVSACGRLPLALSMIGAMMRGRGDRSENVLTKLRTADLGSIRQHFLGYPYSDLLNALQVSVDALPDNGVAARYLDFALFLEDIAVPEEVLLMLWQADGLLLHQAQDDVDLLVERSLAQRDAEGHLFLHDLLFDYVRVVRGDAQARHQQLLAAYRARCPHDWPSGPDDGYFFEYLAHHLHQAGQVEELHRLLGLTADSGTHAWYEAKRAAGDVAGFLSDVDRAWRLAEESHNLGLQLRYALITASLNNLAANIPPRLLAAVAAHGILGPLEVLTHTARTPDPAQRAAALAAIAPHLPLGLIDEALTVANTIAEETVRAPAVGRLAARLAELGHRDRGRAVAESLADQGLRAVAIAELAPYDTAADATRLASELSGSHALAQVAETLARVGHPAAAVDAAQLIDHADTRRQVLRRLAPHLPQPVADEVVTHAFAIADPRERVRALLPLLPHLSERQAHKVLQNIPALRDKAEEAVGLATVAGHLAEPLATLETALSRARKARPGGRGRAVAAIAAHLPEPLVRTTIDLVMGWQLHWSGALAALAGRLAELGHDDEAVDIAGRMLDARTDVLDAIAPHLPATTLAQALVLASAIRDDAARDSAITQLVPHMPVADRREQAGLLTAGSLPSDEWIARAVAVARALDDADRSRVLDDAWQEAREILNIKQRTAALTPLAHDRPDNVLTVLDDIFLGGSTAPVTVWPLFLSVAQYEEVFCALAAAGHADRVASLVRAMKPRETTPFSDHMAELLPDDVAAILKEHLVRRGPEDERFVGLFRTVLSGSLLPHVSAAVRDELAAEALDFLDSDGDRIEVIVGVGDIEDLVFATVVRHLPQHLLPRATELLTKRENVRGFPLTETSIALKPDHNAVPALDEILDKFPMKEICKGNFIRVSFADTSINLRHGHIEFDHALALPRIARGLPRNALDHVLERTAGSPEPTRHVTQALFSAASIRLCELGDHHRALDLARRISDPDLRHAAMRRIGAALTELPRDTLATFWTDQPRGSLLRELSEQARAGLLSDLAALAPAVVALGGNEVATTGIAVIKEAGNWWP